MILDDLRGRTWERHERSRLATCPCPTATDPHERTAGIFDESMGHLEEQGNPRKVAFAH
jgi:hypothetical protein